MEMSGQTSPTIAEMLATRLLRPVAAADRERAALHVVDWTGCAVAAAQSPPALAMRKIFSRTDDIEGVMYWGSLGNFLEMDDVDKRGLLHPGPVIIPAALVGCDLYQCDAEVFLNAIVRGYEATIRIGRAVGPGHYKFWHNTATCGPFGAAAGLAASVPREVPKVVDALSLAGTQASGFWQMRHESRSMAKQLHTARAAHAGLSAFALADEGFIGIRTIFEGAQGFFAATCPDADPGDVIAFDADDPWAMHEVSFKPWAACRHAHAVIDAALALRDRGVVADDVEGLVIRVYADAVAFCDKPEPTDSLSAKFSLQHAAAVTILKGPPTAKDFEGKALDDPIVARLRARAAVKSDATMTRRYPKRFGAALEATTRGGAIVSAVIPDALGDPENPMTEDAVEDKALDLMEYGGLKRNPARRLIRAARDLASGKPRGLQSYLALLREACLA